MKVRKTSKKAKFNSFDITITVESEAEAKALYAIFNHAPNRRLIGSQGAEGVKSTLGKEYYVPYGEIANQVEYVEFYK